MERKIAQPTQAQLAWQDMEMGMFIHWSPCVYQDTQGDDLSTALDQINPSQLDTEQWVDAACAMGAKYIVFVAKHVGGFCTWQTDTTEYSIRNTPWRSGQGDMMADLAASCRKRDIKLGFYLCPRDDYFGAADGGVCANADKQAVYTAMYRQQLTELLSRYGEMVEIWFDGSTHIPVDDILQQYAADAMVFQSPHATIRWVGNEDGLAVYPAWNALQCSDAIRGTSTQEHSDPDGDCWLPLECDTTLRGEDWFWSTTNHTQLKSVDDLMEIYYRSVGNGATLLLNVNPDRSGRIPDTDMQRIKEFGDALRQWQDNEIATVEDVTGSQVDIVLDTVQRINRIELMEDIQHGERIRGFEIVLERDDEMVRLLEGTAVGHKIIIQFPPTKTDRVQLTIHQSVAQPRIRRMAVFYDNR